MTRLAVAATLGIAFALAAVSIAGAQGSDVRIAELECIDDPDVAGAQELVVIVNQGDAAQQLAGWKLVSDPPESEVFELRDLGTVLVAGASVSIWSGPSPGGTFTWGDVFVFRDDDPTDYVRIVDDTGAVVDQVNCGEVAPEPSPTPTPEPSPPNGVPDGGGPPPPPGDALLAATMVLVGGSMAAAGVVTGALSWLRLRSSPVACTTATLAPRQAVAARTHAQPRGPDSSRGGPISAAPGLALVGLLAAAAVLLFLRHRPQ